MQPPTAGTGSEDMLRNAALVLTRTGEAFLPALVQEMARVFGASLAAVAELVPGDRLQTQALWRAGNLVDQVELPVAGTPFEALDRREPIWHPSGAADRFPADALIASTVAEGYFGVPLVGTRDELVGVLLVVTPQPMPEHAPGIAFLQLVAGRVAAEIERRHAERDLRRSEEHLQAVQRVEAIGTLAGHIAHDFNNLLTIMVGYGEVLQERDPGPEVSELLAAARRASTLTRQLLAFGRRQVMQVQRVDLSQVVMQVQTMLTGAIGAQIRLSTSLDPSLPQVEVDPGQLEQVLVNLAINARDAMPEGGTLHIDTAAVDVSRAYFQMPAGRYVRLSVSDTGIGMPPEIVARIFEPFFTTKGSRGTGLGLSSVYGIVKQSGGFIWCDSAPGQGTTFTIYFRPASGAEEMEPLPSRESESARGGDERVLVVDDEPGVRRLMARILRSRGYDVFETEDGPSALALLGSTDRRMDLLVTDLVMPRMSGTRLAEEVQTRWPDVKILFVSGFPRGDAHQTTSRVASVPVLHKPFTPQQIERTVRDLLDTHA
jgi:signal transduction histidine kinase/ActR/RegA family two-component response regulator